MSRLVYLRVDLHNTLTDSNFRHKIAAFWQIHTLLHCWWVVTMRDRSPLSCWLVHVCTVSSSACPLPGFLQFCYPLDVCVPIASLDSGRQRDWMPSTGLLNSAPSL